MQPGMVLESMAFVYNDTIPYRHSCDGGGVIPSFRWIHVPPQTKSLVLAMRQREAPEDQQVHWLLYDLPVMPNIIHEGGMLPEGATVGRNDFGEMAYRPVCHTPDHHLVHYIFTLYATDLPTLGLPEGASWHEVREKLRKPREGVNNAEAYKRGDNETPGPGQDAMAWEWHDLGHVIGYTQLIGRYARDIETHVPGVDRSL